MPKKTRGPASVRRSPARPRAGSAARRPADPPDDANRAASKLTPWPVPFRHPLLAIAPQPAAPVGSLASEALAVGDQGEVARYKPGEGWLPGKPVRAGRAGRDTAAARGRLADADARLCSRRRNREGGEMWLWRGETGLWERDPATPLNFRGNLLGVAFDPNNPTRGYAVGTSDQGQAVASCCATARAGLQEDALPAEVQGASFTSIAFAGSEAIVAYRQQPEPASKTATWAACCCNDGSGWRVDAGSGQRDRAAHLPEAVAGLPDGGAAFATSGPARPARVSSANRPARPGGHARRRSRRISPGSLALFREGGALRADRLRRRRGRQLRDRRPAAAARLSAEPPAAALRSVERHRKRRCSAPDRERLERRGPRTEPLSGTPPAATSTRTCPTGPELDPWRC